MISRGVRPYSYIFNSKQALQVSSPYKITTFLDVFLHTNKDGNAKELKEVRKKERDVERKIKRERKKGRKRELEGAK